ncbi:outer membrane protein [Solimonas soli]|uniref:outer membrane protein n=1 Tax=Solimonas soli TaxID=413479 RepID=UPI00048546AA|nr:outer membrane beta-barrel protein [Solimonas soli]
MEKAGRARACLLLGAVLVSTPAAADPAGFYGGLSAGVGRVKGYDDARWRPVPAATVGYAFVSGLRPELELAYRHHREVDDATAESVMGNLWWDIWNEGYYFYVGGGAGNAWLDVDARNERASDSLAAWQVGLGLGGAVNEHLTVGLNYRHFETFQEPRFSAAGQSSRAGSRFEAQAFLVELRYFFGGGPQDPAPSVSVQPVRVVPVR